MADLRDICSRLMGNYVKNIPGVYIQGLMLSGFRFVLLTLSAGEKCNGIRIRCFTS